jgi:hypothetical protein
MALQLYASSDVSHLAMTAKHSTARFGGAQQDRDVGVWHDAIAGAEDFSHGSMNPFHPS